MRMSARAAFKEKISFIKILAGNKVRDRFFDEWNMRIGKICSLEKEINVVYNIIAEDIFQFILYSYFISHKTIIPKISRIEKSGFFYSKDILWKKVTFQIPTSLHSSEWQDVGIHFFIKYFFIRKFSSKGSQFSNF